MCESSEPNLTKIIEDLRKLTNDVYYAETEAERFEATVDLKIIITRLEAFHA